MESHVSLDSEVHLHSENVSTRDGEPTVKSSIQDQVVVRQPVKKPTRQWAAWTHEEEESFFTALRQVGKNFEKITHRVQSKNKDQVRHYYYRLLRRMNKLLCPGLCLNAKNSKDTNAAMLRWWCLLEKYSCKASKLHLKPRRFKLFIESLENQLLKDRKKNIRKRPLQGVNGSPVTPGAVTNQNRDSLAVKLVLVDSQNIQKMGPAKGSLKRNVNLGIIRANSKGDSTAMKPPRQRRKQGVASSAAYKKWEKAAIAGVSLVADAAEHLERTAIDQGMTGEKENEHVEKVLPSLPVSSQYFAENDTFTNLKLKLQLFPIDDGTRKSLEMDKHNPHLELTLKTRKKISSVLEHLNRKWGNSSVASGELVLFPYGVRRETLLGCPRWSLDSTFSAGDVYASVGSPSIFRLRYGWLSNSEFAPATLQASFGPSCIPAPGEDMCNVESDKRNMVYAFTHGSAANVESGQLVDTCEDLNEADRSHAPAHSSSTVPKDISEDNAADLRSNHSDTATNITWHGTNAGDGIGTDMRQLEEADDLRLSCDTALSIGEWADSLTNISLGDLLSDVNTTYIEPPVVQSGQCLQQISFSCDSFDEAIAAHMSRQQNKMGFPSMVTSTTSSIWDAEETCDADAFSFQKHQSVLDEVSAPLDITSLHAGEQMVTTGSSDSFMNEPHVSEEQVDCASDEDPKDECAPEPQLTDSMPKDFTALKDIYWPDSLGPIDLDMPSSCKYRSEDLILSDSLSSLNRLIASSLDALQNCSFSLDKKDLSSMVEARETTSFPEFKMGSWV